MTTITNRDTGCIGIQGAPVGVRELLVSLPREAQPGMLRPPPVRRALPTSQGRRTSAQVAARDRERSMSHKCGATCRRQARPPDTVRIVHRQPPRREESLEKCPTEELLAPLRSSTKSSTA